MLTVEERPNIPVPMPGFIAPGAGPEAQAIKQAGRAHKDSITYSNQGQVSLEEAIGKTCGFMQIWGRKGGDSNVVACLSIPLIGFDGTDTRSQQLCGLEILKGIEDDDTTIRNYGDHKFLVAIETPLGADAILKKVLEARNKPTENYFPRYRDALTELNTSLNANLVDVPEGEERPFVDIFEGKTEALIRAFQPGKPNNHYFHWGYVEEEGEFVGINPDNNRQTLRQLAENNLVAETGEMLTDAAEDLIGNLGRNRFIIQLDFGIDADCFGDSINAQQEEDESELIAGIDVSALEAVLENDTMTRYFSGGGAGCFRGAYDSEEYCHKCKESKTAGDCKCQ